MSSPNLCGCRGECGGSDNGRCNDVATTWGNLRLRENRSLRAWERETQICCHRTRLPWSHWAIVRLQQKHRAAAPAGEHHLLRLEAREHVGRGGLLLVCGEWTQLPVKQFHSGVPIEGAGKIHAIEHPDINKGMP